jgi:hypothetical protein
MKKTFILPILALLVIASVFGVIATPSACNDNQGSIWTTNGDCGNETQDVNHYSAGDVVYINGDNFCELTYNWTITGNPGGSSGDPGIVVASGSKAVDSSGAFCVEAYTVASDDWGEYKADFGGKNDNYRVDIDTVIPEFGTAVGILTMASAIGIFLFVRRK